MLVPCTDTGDVICTVICKNFLHDHSWQSLARLLR